MNDFSRLMHEDRVLRLESADLRYGRANLSLMWPDSRPEDGDGQMDE